ncbi:hypothetical protein FBUS_07409 [Fasciolopsis buskii]|uniref:Tetraspanin n=1 Tax=Fasciolopsis buskii TaxID=27845 RepID=A0A8E0RJ46_9TREM|nr:hypothetical protein FBUS_07409 [Fasciolopsis buski]
MQRMVLSVNNQYRVLTPEYTSSNWDSEFHRFVDLFFYSVTIWCGVIFALHIFILISLIFRAEFLMLLLMVALSVATLVQLGFVLYQTINPASMNVSYQNYLKYLQANFVGASGNTFTTIMLNYLQHEKSCCGVKGYQEWNSSTLNWNKMVEYSGVQYELHVPLSCCRGLAANFTPDCALSKDTQYIFTRGCSGFVNPLLRYMPIEQYQELSIVFVCLHIASIIVFVVYRCMKRQQLRKYFKKGQITELPAPAVTRIPRHRNDRP